MSGCWTLHCSPDLLEEKKTKKKDLDGDWHSFLITSHNDRTIILSTEETLQEVSTDFYTKGPTFACGNVIGRKFMVQVYHKGIRILKDASKIEGRSDLLFESEVVGAEICDPYVLIRLKTNEVRLYKLDNITLEFLPIEFEDITAVLAEDINPKLQDLDKVTKHFLIFECDTSWNYFYISCESVTFIFTLLAKKLAATPYPFCRSHPWCVCFP